MNLRLQRITAELETIQDLPSCQVLPIITESNPLQVIDVWVVWIKGRKQSVFHPGSYPLTFTFPKQFPRSPPTVAFEEDFLHIHVYKGGNICMPVLSPDFWKPNRTMAQVINRLDDFIHQTPNISSPANSQLCDICIQDRAKYEEIMREQAKKFSQRHSKYFKNNCVHIYLQ